MKVGLFFGTFNPIHVGHLIIANHMAQLSELDQVWLVVTPHNPHKEKASLLADHLRLDMVRDAIAENTQLKVSDIEFHLPKPNYTISTLTHLSEKYPQHEFSLLIGEDNLRNFHKWFNWEKIIAQHRVFVYPRAEDTFNKAAVLSGSEQSGILTGHSNLVFVPDVPVLGISSSFIRKQLASAKDCSYLLTPAVQKFIDDRALYQK
jgi:nicotinate-nucleotide adenylyltransferase